MNDKKVVTDSSTTDESIMVGDAIKRGTFRASSVADIEAYVAESNAEFHVAAGLDLNDREIFALSERELRSAKRVNAHPRESELPQRGLVMWDAEAQYGLAGFAWEVESFDHGVKLLHVDALGSGYDEVMRGVVVGLSQEPHMSMTVRADDYESLDRMGNELREIAVPVLAWLAGARPAPPVSPSKAARKKAAQKSRRAGGAA